MAKFFKVLMSILLIVFIAALAALFVPPLLGVTTVVSGTDKATNMKTGSVAYGTREPISSLSSGDSIIYNTDDETYIYEVTDVNSDDGTISVRTSSGSPEKTIELRRTASKLLFVIPFIGYISIALESLLGTIILILAAVLLVVLFIISDIVSRKARSKKRSSEFDDEEDDEEYEESADSDSIYFNELSKSKTRPHALDALQNQDQSVSASSAPAIDEEIEEPAAITGSETAADPETEIFKAVPSGKKSYGDESVEITFSDDAERKDRSAGSASPFVDLPGRSSVSDEMPAKETGFKADDFDISISEPETAKAPVKSHTADIPDMRAALEAALNSAQVNRSNTFAPVKEVVSEEPVIEMPDEIELAIPVRSLESLLSEAYSKGEDPKVTKDEASGITFVDYSDFLK